MNNAVVQTVKSAPQPVPSVTPRGNVLAQLDKRFGALVPIVARRSSERVIGELQSWTRLSAQFPAHEERARKRLAVIPDRGTLCNQADALRAAIWSKASEPESRLIVATMLEAIPAARDKTSPAHIDAIVYTLSHADEDEPDNSLGFAGFSCTVMFVLARRVIAKHTFTPSAAELLEIARAVRLDHWRALQTTNKLLEFCGNAEEVIDEFDDARILTGEVADDDIPL